MHLLTPSFTKKTKETAIVLTALIFVLALITKKYVEHKHFATL